MNDDLYFEVMDSYYYDLTEYNYTYENIKLNGVVKNKHFNH